MLSANQPISENLPAHGCRHVAIIMDGNGRWAKRQGKIRAFGHKAGRNPFAAPFLLPPITALMR
jgi:undecaprenyl diphosphate synthase